MDPIKVDFSDNGKKKNVKDILIPPEKAGIKIVINIVFTVIVAAVAYYFMLPPMNPGSYDFYIYWAIVLGSYVAALMLPRVHLQSPNICPM